MGSEHDHDHDHDHDEDDHDHDGEDHDHDEYDHDHDDHVEYQVKTNFCRWEYMSCKLMRTLWQKVWAYK